MKENYKPGTFDSRVVSYEDVHKITPEQKEALVSAVDLKENEKVLDVCCGYGSVTKWLIELEKEADFYLSDSSEVQLERARENLPTSCIFDLADVKKLPYENDFFDKVVLKMGLHENPFEEQQDIVNELFRILKPGGTLIIWELYLNEKTQTIFQRLIRKKDELSGFTNLVKRRYFQRKDEIKKYVDDAGFINFKEILVFNPELHTKVRFNELVSREMKEIGKTEMTDDIRKIAKSKLEKLNDSLRELSDEEKKIIKMEDLGNDVVIHNIEKAIVSIQKPF